MKDEQKSRVTALKVKEGELFEVDGELYIIQRPSNATQRGSLENGYDIIMLGKMDRVSAEPPKPDHTPISESEGNKDKAVKEFTEMTAKHIMTFFYLMGLKSHIESMVVNQANGEEFIFSFQTVEYFNQRNKFVQVNEKLSGEAKTPDYNAIKLVAVRFFWYWWNTKGNNTLEGFDTWAKTDEGKKLISELGGSPGDRWKEFDEAVAKGKEDRERIEKLRSSTEQDHATSSKSS